jgi:cytochrome P450
VEAPVQPGLPVIGSILDAQKDALELFTRASRLGDVVEIKFPYYRTYLINRPDLIEHVLHENYKAYGKQTRGYNSLRTLLGNGLLTSEGSFWLRQRRLAQPAFHREKLTAWGDTMVRATRELVDSWEPRVKSGEPFDVHDDMMRLTLRVVGQALMSTDLTGDAAEVGDALTRLLRLLTRRTARLINFPEWIPTPAQRSLEAERARLDHVVGKLIAERRATKAGDDLLGMLMSATDVDTGERMDDVQLRDEVMTILLAGHETTANALSWVFMLLGQSPAAEAKLRAELKAVLSGREPTAADAPKLVYTSAVLHEALRLYPPVWALARSASEDDVIDGVRIPKGALVFFLPWLVHRRGDVWPEPEKFDPDRWLPDAPKPKSRCAFMPFSSGPRKCIGDGFALLEGQLTLATLLQRVKLEPVKSHVVAAEPVFTLRPRDGVKVIARKVDA